MAPPSPPIHLILFGRYPVPGKTKTRLIPVLGPVGAAERQKQMTEEIVHRVRPWARRRGVALTFCHAGADANRLARWLGDSGMTYVRQAAGDLGVRMSRAIQDAFARGARRVLLMGTDLPRVTTAVLASALDGLRTHDIVLGPSTDGGYWLVGMNRPTDLFSGMAWSRPDVLEKTVRRAEKRKKTCYLLDPLTDLDTPEDLIRHRMPAKETSPYLSVIVPARNEERQLAATLFAARSADAEIIVSDGQSRDRTVRLARSFGARIVSGRPGRAVQQNRGAWAARGRVLLFLHADTRLPPDYAAHVFQTLMDRRTILGAFRFATDIETPAMNLIAAATNLRSRWLQMPYGDQALFLRRTDFLKVGGFPERPIAEDLYLVRGLARRGRVAMAPAAAVTSGRRWRQLGLIRTTLINAIIATGCLAGVAPERLAPLYRAHKRMNHA